MALSPDERERLESRLTLILQNLINRPDNVLFARLLDSNRIHESEVSVRIGESDDRLHKIRQDIALRKEWIDLMVRASSHTPWDDFVYACSKKMDVTGRWRPIAAKVLGTHWTTLKYYGDRKRVPTEWLKVIEALPDWTPTATRRSNFSQITGEMVRRLRHAGMSRSAIIKTFNEFLREFDGAEVTGNDIQACLGEHNQEDNK